MKVRKSGLGIIHREEKASLTVEAALVLPIFLYFIIAFLYIIQILFLQEQIQTTITKMSLSLSKTAYIYNDFADVGDILDFDDTIFEDEFDFGLREMADSVVQGALIKAYAGNYFDESHVNVGLIYRGFDGISFYGSRVLDEEKCIDITVRYSVRIPIKFFILEDMRMMQRVRVRAWTGFEVEALYSAVEHQETDEGDIVYITETGTVYHTNKSCSHIKLSVRPVVGIPTGLKNINGSTYKACERCCESQLNLAATYYITQEGTRFHTISNCSSIKRSVKEVKLSTVQGSKLPCKRCAKQ